MGWKSEATRSLEMSVNCCSLSWLHDTHKTVSFIGCAPANWLPHTTGFPVNGLQDDILIYTSPISTVPQKKDLMNKKKCSAILILQKKKRISPFLDEALLVLFQNAYSATQVNSDPQGKGFLCKQKEKKEDVYWNKLGDFSFSDLWQNVLYREHILYCVNFVPTDMELWTYCDQIMALKWSDYVLTDVTLWLYSDHIMTLQ